MPYFCRARSLAGAQPPRAAREGLADPRARRGVQAGHPATCASAGAQAHLAAAERGSRGLVPRPACPAHRRAGRRLSAVSYEPGKYDCVVIVWILSLDTSRWWTRRRSSSTSTTRRAPRQRGGARLQAERDLRRPAGLGYWGHNLARNFDDPDRPALALRRERGGEAGSRAYSDARVTGDFDGLLAADDVDAVVIATPSDLPAARAALEAGKHVFVEAAGDADRRDGGADRARRAGGRPHAGHLLPTPGRAEAEGADRRRRLGEVLVVYGNRQNLGKIRKDERALVARRPDLSAST